MNYNPNILYDKKYLKTSLIILADELKDLSMWSVYNNDKYNNEIDKIKNAFKKLLEEVGEK